VATRIDSFADYQSSEAWTWEHMALTRARVISGPAEPAAAHRNDHPRDADAAARRRQAEGRYRRHARAHPSREGQRRSLGAEDGGGRLIDIEFIAQYLQLAHAAEHPDILRSNTAAALAAARQAGVMSRGDAEVLEPALAVYQAVIEVLRLCVSGPFDPAACPRGLARQLARAADVPDLAAPRGRPEGPAARRARGVRAADRLP
jgi:[glutamine synthetase] adenylyltransferase / [glutamine synthetase]-adenylyl-L-tyrosine phosphorylase